MNYGQVLPGYAMQQPMQQAHPQQIQVVIQEQPMVEQPDQQQVQQVELQRIPQELQCPQCKLTVVSKVDYEIGNGTFLISLDEFHFVWFEKSEIKGI